MAKSTTVTVLSGAGKALLLIAALGAMAGMAVVIVWFDEFDGLGQHLRGVRAAVGLLLIAVGLVTAIGGLLVKTTSTSEELASKGVIEGLGQLLDRPGGLGLALVVVGALLLGLTLNADADHDDDKDDAPTVVAPAS